MKNEADSEIDKENDDSKNKSEIDKSNINNFPETIIDPNNSPNLINDQQASGRLWKIRKFFLTYSLLYIFLKILLGALFLVLPIVIFRIVLTKIQMTTDNESEYYIYAFIPLIVSVSIIIFYFVFLIFYKLISICYGNRYFLFI
jgi:hypothetical protein